jgi:threonine dehydrogenase-like Zn-dependent dehydrogenase
MRTLVFVGDSKVEVRDVPDPVPGPGQVLVRIRNSAICGSELHGYRNGAPTNGGHELVGEVVEANAVDALHPGDRVAINVMSNGCGRCHWCLSGEPKHCSDLKTLWGGHGDLFVAPGSSCYSLPDDVPFESGVLLGGDFVGTSYRAIKRAGVTALDSVLVIGAGPIGLGVLSILRYLGLRVIVSEPSAYRRDLCAEAGAIVFDPLTTDSVAATNELTAGLGPTVVFDCVGRPETQTLSLDIARPKGKVCFIGESRELTINPSRQIIHKELTLIGSVYFTLPDFQEIIALYRQGYRPDRFATHRYPLEQADVAYRTFVAGNTGKVLFTY